MLSGVSGWRQAESGWAKFQVNVGDQRPDPNKGPYVAGAVALLTGILTRMAEHHTKKRTLMRPIHAWDTSR